MNAAVIGVGNPYRRDDGVGPAVIEALRDRVGRSVTLTVCDGEPTQLLDAWVGTDLAVVVDAVLCEPAEPGRIHRSGADATTAAATGWAGSHALGIPDAIRLAEVLDRAPRRLVVFAVEAADIGFGCGLSREVAAAVPDLVETVLGELRRARSPEPDTQPS